jgi:transcriptional regulator of arginine metabolism
MNDYSKRGDGVEEDAVARRVAIVELVSDRPVRNQAELGRLLRQRGIRATQATLSRDLRSLGVGKVPAPDGPRYVLPAPSRDVIDTRRRQIELETFVQAVRAVGNLVLVRTPPGNAHGVGRALDLLGWAEVAGTLAGDDTVLVVTETAAAGRAFRRRLASLVGRSFE